MSRLQPRPRAVSAKRSLTKDRYALAKEAAENAINAQLAMWGFAPETGMWEHLRAHSIGPVTEAIDRRKDKAHNTHLNDIAKRKPPKLDFMNPSIAAPLTASYLRNGGAFSGIDRDLQHLAELHQFESVHDIVHILIASLEKIGAQAALGQLGQKKERA